MPLRESADTTLERTDDGADLWSQLRFTVHVKKLTLSQLVSASCRGAMRSQTRLTTVRGVRAAMLLVVREGVEDKEIGDMMARKLEQTNSLLSVTTLKQHWSHVSVT